MKAFIPSKVAEIVFALILCVFAYNHFTAADMMSGMASNMPGGGKLWVYITGAALALAAIAIVTGIQKTLACYLLAAMLIVFVLMIHLKSFNAAADDMGKSMAMLGILKDLAMAMAAILIGNNSKT